MFFYIHNFYLFHFTAPMHPFLKSLISCSIILSYDPIRSRRCSGGSSHTEKDYIQFDMG